MKPVRAGATAKVLLLLVSSLTVMAGAIIAPSLPGVQAAFAQVPSIELLSRLVLTTPALAVAISATPLGWLTHAVGRKPVLLAGLVVYGIGGSSGVYVESVSALLIGRALLGVGVAATLTCVAALIADYFSGEERSRLIGLQGAFMGFGGMLFLVGGGALADLSWRAPFASYLAAFLLVPAAALGLAEPPRARERPRDAIPSEPDKVLDRRLVAVLYASATLGFVLFYLIPVQLPFALTKLGASGARVGLALGVMTLISSLSSLFYTRLAGRFRSATILSATFFTMVPGFVLLAVADSYGAVLLALILIAPPLGQLMPNIANWLSGLSPVAARGRVLGGLTMAIFSGQFLSPIAAAPWVARSGLSGAFAAAAVCAAGVGVGVAILTRSSTA